MKWTAAVLSWWYASFSFYFLTSVWNLPYYHLENLRIRTWIKLTDNYLNTRSGTLLLLAYVLTQRCTFKKKYILCWNILYIFLFPFSFFYIDVPKKTTVDLNGYLLKREKRNKRKNGKGAVIGLYCDACETRPNFHLQSLNNSYFRIVSSAL